MSSLRDALSAAIDKAEEGSLQTPAEVSIETEAPIEAPAETTAEQRSRDQQGRFAPKIEPEVTAPTVRKPPSSWKKDYWGHWDELGTNPKLAPLQEYIEKREADYANGVSTYKNQWDQAQPLMKAMEPFMAELQQAGITPDKWISNLGNAHKMLSLGNPEQKAQVFAKLASDYGVNLQAMMGGRVDPQFGHLAQTVNALQNKLQQFETQAQAQEQNTLQGFVNGFKADKPHFESVKTTMGQLIQSGLIDGASSMPAQQLLQAAYDKAIRFHDDIWQQEQAQQASSANRQVDLARKKAAASSPRSASPTGPVSSGGGKKSLRDHLSEAVDQVAGGRF